MKAILFAELSFASDTVQPVRHAASVSFLPGFLFKSDCEEKRIGQDYS